MAESEAGSSDSSTEVESLQPLASPPFPRFQISGSELEYTDRLYDYGVKKHAEEFEEYAHECPDSVERMSEEFAYKQRLTWFVAEKVLPSTGKTVLEEFVEKYVMPNDPALASRMLQMKEVIRGSFKILDNRHLPYMTIEHLESGSRYVAASKVDPSEHFFRAGDIIRGRIHPWGDKFYMFDGILIRQESEEEIARRLGLVTPDMLRGWLEKDWTEGAESMIVSNNTTLSAAMNKYPWQWVDGICKSVGIDPKGMRKREKVKAIVSKLESGCAEQLLRDRKIPKASVEALRMLVENGFVLKYGALTRRFSTEVGFWWNDEPPQSDIGLLRLHGMVVVGRMPMQGRLYRVALIPLEVRAPIKKSLSL